MGFGSVGPLAGTLQLESREAPEEATSLPKGMHETRRPDAIWLHCSYNSPHLRGIVKIASWR